LTKTNGHKEGFSNITCHTRYHMPLFRDSMIIPGGSMVVLQFYKSIVIHKFEVRFKEAKVSWYRTRVPCMGGIKRLCIPPKFRVP